MINEEEITFELTDYCPNDCKYCSSDCEMERKKAVFLSIKTVQNYLFGKKFKHIILSGGEPLAHHNFWNILQLCKQHSDDVVIYTNAITHLIYNANVIDGVYLEANLTITPETDKIHILRRVKQGKESNRPEVHLSKNHSKDCSCNHGVVRPDGNIYKTPCNKYEKQKEK